MSQPEQASRHAVFISYRRDDAGGWPGRLQAHLADHFGSDRVFRDVGIPAGVDYEDHIDGVLDGCSVLLAMIGPGWMTTTAADGTPRLTQPDDLLREEIERALGRPDITVIPVLVGKAVMPTAADLPESLRPLARRQAMVLTDARWEHDVGLVVDRLSELVGDRRRGARRETDRRKNAAPRRGKLVALVAMGTILAVAAGMFTLRDALFPAESGHAHASLVDFQRSVAAVCTGLNDADIDIAAIGKQLTSKLRSAKTLPAKRKALLDAAQKTNARAARELAAFKALSSPPSTTGRRRATLANWTANQARLGMYEQRLDRAHSEAGLRAAIGYLTTAKPGFAADAIDVRAGLINLGGGKCALKSQSTITAPTLPRSPTRSRASRATRAGEARAHQPTRP